MNDVVRASGGLCTDLGLGALRQVHGVLDLFHGILYDSDLLIIHSTAQHGTVVIQKILDQR